MVYKKFKNNMSKIISFNKINLNIERNWFKPNKYIPFIPIKWESYLIYVVLLFLVALSFYYFDVLSLEFNKIIYFMISVIFVLILFVILSKNTIEEKVIKQQPTKPQIKIKTSTN